MFTDTDGPGGVVVGKNGNAAPWNFGTTVASAPLIRGLQEHVARDIRVGPQVAWTKLVLGLDAIDLLDPSDWAASREPAHIGLHALQRMVTRRVGVLNRLSCCFQFNGLLDRAQHSLHADEASSLLSNLDLDSSLDYLMFSVVVDEPVRCYTLERRITRLEKSIPGLGSAVVDWIGRAGWRTVGVLTPDYVLRMVSYLQWMGEDDERELLAQWRSEGMTEEAIRSSDLIRRADLDAEFPAYVLGPNNKLSRAMILPMPTHAPAWARKVAVALAQVMDLITHEDARLLSLEQIDAESIYVAVALRWNESDMSTRVLDDWVNGWMQGGECTEFQGLQAVTLESVALSDFFKRLDLGLQLLTALDRLIALVSEPERAKEG